MGTIARYTEPSSMSIRVSPLPTTSLALMREAHLVLARALGIAFVAAALLVLDGVVRTLPGMACLIASRALDPAPFGTSERWVLVALAGCALVLDGTDGWAARRQGLASAFGARFDMEIDAFAIAVLAITAVKAASAPCWVLAIGAMRYLYLFAGRVFPVLRRPPAACAFADRRRKAIAVVQSLALLCSLAPPTPPIWAAATCALALGLLAYSFAADIVMLLFTKSHKRGRISRWRNGRHPL